ncbi:MAG: hypothetical protein AVDCRST_MAG49-3888, partial [uncultured Thermomicrobiales bacterium]
GWPSTDGDEVLHLRAVDRPVLCPPQRRRDPDSGHELGDRDRQGDVRRRDGRGRL